MVNVSFSEKKKEIEILKSGIKKYVPVVAEFFGNEDTIVEHAIKIKNNSVDNVFKQRQATLAAAIKKQVERLFVGKIDLSDPLVFNIVDHHSVLNHPILLSTNIVANADTILSANKNTPQKPIVVLTSGVVPPNNFFNKKGFLYHKKKVPLFSNQEMHQATCFIKKHDLDFVTRLKQIKKWQSFDKEERNFLEEINNKINSLDFSKAVNFSDQVAIVNKFLWKQLFEQNLRGQIPDLYYVSQESIIKYVLPDLLKTDNLISRSLFNGDFRKIILSKFNGLTGCWSEDDNLGTYFFWLKNEKNEISRLYIGEHGYLSDETGAEMIELDPDIIGGLLRSGRIIPNLFIIFGYITFWCGVKPLVGHGSCNYLTAMKDAWISALKESDCEEDLKRIEGINTKSLIGGSVVTLGRDANGKLQNLYALDIIQAGGLSEDYLAKILSLKFSVLLKPTLLEIYNSYVPVSERKLLNLSPVDLVGNELDFIK